MKFSSKAMLAVAATSISMVSAYDHVSRELALEDFASLTTLLQAECAPPATSPPSKGKGTKGEDRRQLQAKSGGKGSKSGDSDDITCTGKWLARTSTGTVIDACGLVKTTPVNTPPIGSSSVLSAGPAGTDGQLFLNAGVLVPSTVSINFVYPAVGGVQNQDFINSVKASCDFDVPVSTDLGTDFILAPRAVSATIPISLVGEIIPFGTLSLTGTAAGSYDIFYVIVCGGSFESDVSENVAQYLNALDDGGCFEEEEEEESGKKA